MTDLFEQKITPDRVAISNIIKQCYTDARQGHKVTKKSQSINMSTKAYFNHLRYALHVEDKTIGYDFPLISELPTDGKPFKGTIYLEKQEGKLNYKLMTIKGETVYEKTDIAMSKDFHELTGDEYRGIKNNIMDDILKKGHAKCISRIINDFFERYMTYLDTKADAFQANFINGYGERVFELVMANFLNSTFSLTPRTDEERSKVGGISDLSFSFNKHQYLLECTTRDSFLVKDYIDSFGNFDKFIGVSSIFHHCYQELLTKGEPQGQWFGISDHVFYELEKNEKEAIAEKMGFKVDENPKKPRYLTPQMILKNFVAWLFYTRHMLMHYYDIFPQNIIAMLADVGLTNRAGMSWGHDEVIFTKVLTRFVAQCILSKLGKNYFEEGKPVVISVSLSLMADIRLITQAEGLISDIVGYLPSELDALFKNRIENGECRYGIKNPSDSVGKLYAVIIDTSWYNWFPGINKSNMPEGYDNCYGVVYNTNISDDIKAKSEPDIFSQIVPFTHKLPFVLEDKIEETVV